MALARPGAVIQGREVNRPGKCARRLLLEQERRFSQLRHRPVSIGTTKVALAASVSLEHVLGSSSICRDRGQAGGVLACRAGRQLGYSCPAME